MVDRSSEAPHAMSFIVDENDGFKETANAMMLSTGGERKGSIYRFKPASVGFDFIKIMNLKLAEGRDFSKSLPRIRQMLLW